MDCARFGGLTAQRGLDPDGQGSDAGCDGVAPGSDAFGSDGTDADTDEAAGGEAFEVDPAPADKKRGEVIRDGGTGGPIDRGGLHFVELLVGHGGPAGAQFSGVAIGLGGETEGSRHGGGGPRGAAQRPPGTDEGFVAPVGVFASHGGGAQFFLAVEQFGGHGGTDGFQLLLQGGVLSWATSWLIRSGIEA